MGWRLRTRPGSAIATVTHASLSQPERAGARACILIRQITKGDGVGEGGEGRCRATHSRLTTPRREYGRKAYGGVVSDLAGRPMLYCVLRECQGQAHCASAERPVHLTKTHKQRQAPHR